MSTWERRDRKGVRRPGCQINVIRLSTEILPRCLFTPRHTAEQRERAAQMSTTTDMKWEQSVTSHRYEAREQIPSNGEFAETRPPSESLDAPYQRGARLPGNGVANDMS